MFDNAFDTVGTPTALTSSAIVLFLDLHARTAEVIERYLPPQSVLYVAAFGSFQILPNGDRFVGWDTSGHMTQHTGEGIVVYHAQISDETAPNMGSYRTFKPPFADLVVAKSRPDLYSFSWTCSLGSAFHVSWNGASDVDMWVFYGGREVEVSCHNSQFHEIMRVKKKGFRDHGRGKFIYPIWIC